MPQQTIYDDADLERVPQPDGSFILRPKKQTTRQMEKAKEGLEAVGNRSVSVLKGTPEEAQQYLDKRKEELTDTGDNNPRYPWLDKLADVLFPALPATVMPAMVPGVGLGAMAARAGAASAGTLGSDLTQGKGVDPTNISLSALFQGMGETAGGTLLTSRSQIQKAIPEVDRGVLAKMLGYARGRQQAAYNAGSNLQFGFGLTPEEEQALTTGLKQQTRTPEWFAKGLIGRSGDIADPSAPLALSGLQKIVAGHPVYEKALEDQGLELMRKSLTQPNSVLEWVGRHGAYRVGSSFGRVAGGGAMGGMVGYGYGHGPGSIAAGTLAGAVLIKSTDMAKMWMNPALRPIIQQAAMGNMKAGGMLGQLALRLGMAATEEKDLPSTKPAANIGGQTGSTEQEGVSR